MRSYGHRKWRTLFLAAGDSDFHEAIQHLVEHEDINVILVGAVDSIISQQRHESGGTGSCRSISHPIGSRSSSTASS